MLTPTMTVPNTVLGEGTFYQLPKARCAIAPCHTLGKCMETPFMEMPQVSDVSFHGTVILDILSILRLRITDDIILKHS